MRTAALVSLSILTLTWPLHAQAPRAPHVFLGGSFIVAQPQQEFSDYVNTSFGGSLHALWKPDANGPLGLRFEGGGIGYGNERKRVPLSSTIGGRVNVDLTTSNFIVFGHVGPQLTLPSGAIRPYVAPSAGFAYIATVSSVSGVNNGQNIAQQTNYDDFLFSYGATGGIYLLLSRGRVPVLLDLSTRYYQNGKASYLIEGSIQDNPDGSISFTPINSRTNLLTFQVGVSVGIVNSGKRHLED
ncbi:MAG TPA: hypothetical protein VF021_11855 [Longimicrobiales bacterium]